MALLSSLQFPFTLGTTIPHSVCALGETWNRAELELDHWLYSLIPCEWIALFKNPYQGKKLRNEKENWRGLANKHWSTWLEGHMGGAALYL